MNTNDFRSLEMEEAKLQLHQINVILHKLRGDRVHPAIIEELEQVAQVAKYRVDRLIAFWEKP